MAARTLTDSDKWLGRVAKDVETLGDSGFQVASKLPMHPTTPMNRTAMK